MGDAVIAAAPPVARWIDGKLVAFEPDGVTPLHHVKWGEGVADRDVPTDGEPMEWMRGGTWSVAPAGIESVR